MSGVRPGENRWSLAGFLNDNVMDLRAIVGGMESQAYSFRDGAGEHILRVNREAAGFEKDAFAYRHFAGERLPIPCIEQIGELKDGRFYCVSHKLPGRTLEDLRPHEISPTLEATGRVLREIAEAPVSSISGFGPFDAHGKTQFGSWREFLLSGIESAGADRDLVRIIQRFVDFCPETPRLIHGDFGSNNVLTDGRNITGVLDWSEAMIGDPLYDVANVFFWRGWLDCMEALALQLEKQMHPIPYWRERVHCYQACIALRELAG